MRLKDNNTNEMPNWVTPQDTSIGFLGLGKLGKPVFDTMCEEFPHCDGYDPVHTPEKTLEEVVKGKDFVFIAVPTPHEKQYDGSQPTYDLPVKDFDYTILKEVLIELDQVLDKNTLVCLISTVLPGTIRNQLLQYVNNYRFVYNPYLIGMGTVREDFLNPEMMIVGSDNPKDAYELKMLYDWLLTNEVRWEIGTIEEAECIKVFYNTFISAKLGLVNMIQDVAHKVGNINSENVAMALANSTYRIMSRMYMKPGMGDGGPCHPRDNIALRKLAQDLDLGYDLFAEIMKARDMQAKNMADFLSQFDMPVVIMNRNFKKETDLEDGSPFTLVGSFIDDVQYEHVSAVPSVYLYGFGVTEDDWAPCSIVVDVTRQYETNRDDIRVIHYGDTRV